MSNTNRFRLFYLFGYGAMGVMNPLISQYLSSIGFSGTEIGTVTSAATFAAVLASVFWGERYSNSSDGRKVIAFICISAAVMGFVNSAVTGFLIFLLTYSVQYFFQGPVMGVSDALVLEQDQENFSSIRLCGAAGYAAAVFAGGRIGDAVGLESIFYIYACVFVLAGCTVITSARPRRSSADQSEEESLEYIKKETSSNRGAEKAENGKVRYSELLKDRKAIQLIICGIFVMGTNVANNTYFGFLFREGGGTVAGVGTAFLLMVGSEAPFMALAPYLCRKFSREKTILAAMALSAARFLFYAAGPSSEFLLITFFLQGMVNGILLTEYVKYLSEVVEPRLIGMGVAAFYAVSSNGGTILCNFFGGIAMDWLNSRGVYALFSALNAAGALLYLYFGLHKTTKKGIDRDCWG